MSNTSQTPDEDDLKRSQIVLYLLAFMPLVYALLLVLLEFVIYDPAAEATANNEILYTLPLILLGVALVNIILVFQLFIPKINRAEDFNSTFSYSLITVVLIEAISIYGLLIGLLDIFALVQPIQWTVVGLLIGVSFLLALYIIRSVIEPKFREYNYTY